jgi:hypothetical protein
MADPVPGEAGVAEWGYATPGRDADTSCDSEEAHKGKSTMDDPNASGDADRTLTEAEDHLLAADAADMHRLLAWYYGAEEPNGPHLPYPQAQDTAA